MKIKVERVCQLSSLDIKRCYVPFTIYWTCPNCKTKCERDLDNQYLSYPKIGTYEEAHLWCYECDHEVKVEIKLDLTLKAREVKVQTND